MPYRLNTKAAPFAGTLRELVYKHPNGSESPEHMAYAIISCFASVERSQMQLNNLILGGEESMAAIVFSTSITRLQKRNAILAAAEKFYANQTNDHLALFQRAVKVMTPLEATRDRLAHWVLAEVVPEVPKALVLYNPRDWSNPGSAIPAQTSPWVYDEEELIQLRLAMIGMIECWLKFRAMHDAISPTHKTYYSARDAMMIGLDAAESILANYTLG